MEKSYTQRSAQLSERHSERLIVLTAATARLRERR
jgi:hypothetical protein